VKRSPARHRTFAAVGGSTRRPDKRTGGRAKPGPKRKPARAKPRAPRPPAAAPVLTKQKRNELRALAHALEPIVHVGHAGVHAPIVEAVQRALVDHELIKVRLREPEDKHAMAQALADQSNAALCGLIGHTVILYRPHEKPDEASATSADTTARRPRASVTRATKGRSAHTAKDRERPAKRRTATAKRPSRPTKSRATR
jgi:RNA-binding protein